MDFTDHKASLFLLILLSLLLLTYARVNLDPSDLKAFSIIHKDLGINGQRSSFTNPCNNPGVFCEGRLSNNNTYVLKITRLVFKSQRFTGFLSPAIGRLSELKELSLPNNQLVDQFPPQIVDCKKLEILDLGNNQFSGEIPSQLSNLLRLRVLDLSNNKFSGNLSFLKQFPNLERLSLANNLFTGRVPKSIRSFRNLQFFDFSGNNFLEGYVSKAGSIASQYPKRYLLAQNNTTRGSKNVSSAAGPTATMGSAQAPSPSSTGGAHHKSKKSKKRFSGWILGFLAGAVAGTISGFVFLLMFKLALAAIRGGGRDSGPAIFSTHVIKKAEHLAFLEKEDGLANLEVIGRGGCGEVYKAELPGSNGKMIAIKKIVQPSRDAAELTEEDRTVGYIAPEYHQTLKFTDRCDIYSFGVLLGVLVMGKLPSDEFFQTTREMSLVKWMRNVMTSENPIKAIDPSLIDKGYDEQMFLVLKIACFCTLDDPKQRPNSKDIRCMLSQIKH
ncbi:hypothetical protein GH714_040608 [Hevea brasiliensis]|uniref:Protein kinase domain-containing protein n=1 Tax=Hevea brasiliensis TaxID=3981 RepID=A0A6A6KX90_HEVBR|nr:hypothetical protein GH714_040608 [Hevea brasiliensis]